MDDSVANTPSLEVNIAGLRLSNPTMLASGILGTSAEIFKRICDEGAGAVVTKSISSSPRAPYGNPTVIGMQHGVLNAIGLANPGSEKFAKEIADLDETIPIILSVFGASAEEMVMVMSNFNSTQILAYELNLSCPHVKNVGLEIGSDPETVAQMVTDVKKSSSKPIFAKLSPNASDIVKIAKAAEDAGADAITATNTIRAMSINVETGMPVLSNQIGGLSGRALKPVSLRCVYEISKAVNIPVIGCGGVEDHNDALEYLMSGASAVQIGSAIAYKGIEIFGDVVNGIRIFLKKKGFDNVKDVIGLAHRA